MKEIMSDDNNFAIEKDGNIALPSFCPVMGV